MQDVTQEMIDKWKQEYGACYVVRHPICDVYYRPLSRQDYMAIMQKQMSGMISVDPELDTVRTCVLNEVPEGVFSSVGGIVTVVYEQIMINSGFVRIESEEL